MIRMNVVHIIANTNTNSNIVILQMEKEFIYLLIGVGPGEARAIATSLLDVRTIRPLTHDLIKSVIIRLGASVDSVIIHAVTDSIFHANLVLNTGQERLELDARSSDGIALALKCGAPVYVAETVIAQAGMIIDSSTEEFVPLASTYDTSRDQETLDSLSVFREIVESLDIDDLGD